MNNKVSPDTIARTICLIITLLNQLLAILGKDKLPFTENDIYQAVSVLFTIVVATINWWKNNSFTKEAIQADELLKKLKIKEW